MQALWSRRLRPASQPECQNTLCFCDQPNQWVHIQLAAFPGFPVHERSWLFKWLGRLRSSRGIAASGLWPASLSLRISAEGVPCSPRLRKGWQNAECKSLSQALTAGHDHACAGAMLYCEQAITPGAPASLAASPRDMHAVRANSETSWPPAAVSRSTRGHSHHRMAQCVYPGFLSGLPLWQVFCAGSTPG